MQGKETDFSWLGAEALPGDLAEINRVYEAMHDGAAGLQKSTKILRPRGLIFIAVRWLKLADARR